MDAPHALQIDLVCLKPCLCLLLNADDRLCSFHCAEWLFNLLFLESDLITAGGKGCGFAVGISLSSPMPQVSSFFSP